jgi:hypothetical protein
MNHSPLPSALIEPKLDPDGLITGTPGLNESHRLIDAITSAGDDLGLDSPNRRLNVDPEEVRRGLGRLVLTLVKLLHDVLERQAVRRMEGGSLSDDQIERLGTTLMLQAREIRTLCREFGVDEADLNLDLGPLGRLL